MRFFSNTDLFTTNTDIANYFYLACCLFLLTIIFSSCGDYLRSCPDECLPENLDNSWGLPADCDEACRRRVEGTDTRVARDMCGTARLHGRCLRLPEYKLLGPWANTECPSDWVFSINQDGAFSELTIDPDYMFNSDGTFIVNEKSNLIYGKWSMGKKYLYLTYDEANLKTFRRKFIVLSIERGRFEFVDEDGHVEVWSRTPWTGKTKQTIGVDTKGLTPGINFTIVGNSATDNLSIPCDIAKQLRDGMYYVDTKGNIINIEGKIVMKLAELYEGS